MRDTPLRTHDGRYPIKHLARSISKTTKWRKGRRDLPAWSDIRQATRPTGGRLELPDRAGHLSWNNNTHSGGVGALYQSRQTSRHLPRGWASPALWSGRPTEWLRSVDEDEALGRRCSDAMGHAVPGR